LNPVAIPQARSPSGPSSGPPMRVVVVNFDMPFLSMVGFMVKWTLAAIPALMLLWLIGVALVVGCALVAASLGLALRGVPGAGPSRAHGRRVRDGSENGARTWCGKPCSPECLARPPTVFDSLSV